MNIQQQESKLTSTDIVAVPKQAPDSDREQEQRGKQVHAREDELYPLFSPEAGQEFRNHWDAVQIGFVDEPRRAVQQANELVAEVMQSLTKTFAEERSRLETEWQHGDQLSTENLRVVLHRYRAFFQRLLSI